MRNLIALFALSIVLAGCTAADQTPADDMTVDYTDDMALEIMDMDADADADFGFEVVEDETISVDGTTEVVIPADDVTIEVQ